MIRRTYHIEDTVDIEGGVDDECRVKNLSPKITTVREFKRVSRKRKKTIRWIFDVSVQISSVITFFVLFVQVGKEGLTTSRKSIGHHGVLGRRGLRRT